MLIKLEKKPKQIDDRVKGDHISINTGCKCPL